MVCESLAASGRLIADCVQKQFGVLCQTENTKYVAHGRIDVPRQAERYAQTTDEYIEHQYVSDI